MDKRKKILPLWNIFNMGRSVRDSKVSEKKKSEKQAFHTDSGKRNVNASQGVLSVHDKGNKDGSVWMKKNMLPFVMSWIMIALVVAVTAYSIVYGGSTYTLDDSYEGPFDHDFDFKSNQWLSQAFIPNNTITLDMVSVRIRRGNMDSNLQVYIRETGGDNSPTDVDLASNTTIPYTDVPTDIVWLNITFDSPASLTAGTQYAVLLTLANLNEGYWKDQSSGNYYTQGTSCADADGVSWTNCHADRDLGFRIWNKSASPASSEWGSSGLLKPDDSSAITSASVNLNATIFLIGGTNATNYTFYIWDNAGTLINRSTYFQNYTLDTNVSHIKELIPLSTYHWNMEFTFINSSDHYNVVRASSNYTFANFIRINAYNYLGVHLDSSRIWTNGSEINTTSNPYEVRTSTLLGSETSKNITFEIRDLESKHRDFAQATMVNNTMAEINFTLSPNQLFLNFTRDGSQWITNGVVGDSVWAKNFTAVSVVIVQENFTVNDMAWVTFGTNTSGNWTQYYEYYNTGDLHVQDDIEVLPDPNWYSYFKVLDISNRPIENAKIRVSCITPTNIATNYSLVGQRLTRNDGTTHFLTDYSQHCVVDVLADNYEGFTRLYLLGDETANTKASAHTINLESSSSSVLGGVWMWSPTIFTNRSLDIPLVVTAPSRSQIKYTTDYRISQGTANKTAEEGILDRWTGTIESGTDFSVTGSSDIIVYIMADGNLIGTRTIEFREEVEIFDIKDFGLDSTYLNIAIVVILIIASGMMSWIFTSTTAGFTTFMALSIGAVFISSSFWWLTLVGVLYFGFKASKRIFSE